MPRCRVKNKLTLLTMAFEVIKLSRKVKPSSRLDYLEKYILGNVNFLSDCVLDFTGIFSDNEFLKRKILSFYQDTKYTRKKNLSIFFFL